MGWITYGSHNGALWSYIPQIGHRKDKEMATSKFKGESPYKTLDMRKHHTTDMEYGRYLSDVVPDSERKSLKVIRMALFGLGRAGMIHLRNILANRLIQLVYVVEMEESTRETIKQAWNLQDTTFLHPKDANIVYEDPSIDACLVATPTFTHEEIICQVLKSGKDVFSEKPISQEEKGTEMCYDLAQKTGKILFCAFNRRYDPSFMDAKSRILRGEIGHVQMVKTTSRDSPLPSIEYLKISSGIFHDCAVHDIDLITWMCGELPTEVFTAANAQIPEIKSINDYDNVAITLKFKSGTIGMIDLSRFSSYGYDQRLELFGGKAMIQVENARPNSAVSCTIEGDNRVPIFYSFPSRYAGGYANELDYFVKSIQSPNRYIPDGRDTMAVSKIATACEQSARCGAPVKIDWAEEEIPFGYH